MKRTLSKNIVILFKLFLLGLSGAIFSLAAIYLYLSPNLPSVESVRDVRLQTPLRVYSSDNKLIGEFGEKRRIPVKLEDVPQPFIDALLAAEDADFYSHRGVSIRGLARAASELIRTGQKGSGGSTLTMQLTRNIFLSLDQKFIRKFNEILLSLKLERELSKNEILELYVNYMFLGKRAYGIQSASRVYYGKDLRELSLAQLAMIAGLFKGPSTQNPIINPTRAIQRRNWILGRMLDLKMINQEDYQNAKSEAVSAQYHGNQLDANAPYVAELAREKAIRSFGIKAYTEGYKVYTTVNSRMQLRAQTALVSGLLRYDERHGYRGPELSLSQHFTAQDDTPDQLNYSPETLVEALQEVPDYAGLMPATVLKVEEKSLSIMLKGGQLAQLEWQQGLETAREYINENRRGPKPASASDLFSIGDVLRVKKGPTGDWQLSQLPDAQAALVALAPQNGAIRSIVGGFDFYESNFNRATQAYRQPGSNLKPFIYATAIENGLSAATVINDAPVVFDDAALEATWRPENDSGKFYGPTRLRKALYLSRNIVSIRLLQQIGIETARKSLERFGFDPKTLPRDLTLALGNSSVTPLDMATAWATFANGGHKISPYLIQRVVDADGNIIYEAFPDTVCNDCDEPQIDTNEEATPHDFDLPIQLKRELGLLDTNDYPRAAKVLDDRVVFIMDSMLRDIIQRGTGRRAKVLARPDLGGKTGTTNGPLDAWFSGYSRDIVTSTWVGFDQQKPLGDNEFGGTAALPIWIDFMREALKGTKTAILKQPPGIVTVKINPETGERAKIDDPDATFEFFRAEFAPQNEETNETPNQEVPIDVFSGDIF